MARQLGEKGQALVEFIIIIPIFLILIMGTFDFGNILYQKYKLENSLDYVTDLYRNDKDDDLTAYLDNNDIDMNTRLGDDYAVLELSKKVNVVTPGLDLIIGDSHKIKTSRIIYEG